MFYLAVYHICLYNNGIISSQKCKIKYDLQILFKNFECSVFSRTVCCLKLFAASLCHSGKI